MQKDPITWLYPVPEPHDTRGTARSTRPSHARWWRRPTGTRAEPRRPRTRRLSRAWAFQNEKVTATPAPSDDNVGATTGTDERARRSEATGRG